MERPRGIGAAFFWGEADYGRVEGDRAGCAAPLPGKKEEERRCDDATEEKAGASYFAILVVVRVRELWTLVQVTCRV